MIKFVVYKDKKKEWRFRIVASNGRILAHSEGYTRRGNCIKAIHTIKIFAHHAKIML